MIKARHNPFHVRFFRFYSRFMLYKHFREINLKGSYNEKNLPVLLIGNHFSWWDGFIANYLNSILFRRRFHIMMLEEQLETRLFLNKAGAYSIKKKSKDMVESLRYTQEILNKNKNLVALYPQGEIQSLYHYPVKFEKGISSVIKDIPNKVQIVFLAALVDYFSYRKPTLTLALQEYNPEEGITTTELENAYNKFFIQMINDQKEYS